MIRVVRVKGRCCLCLSVPVWYEWRDDVFIVVAWPNSMWASLVTTNPTVALSIDEPWPPMRRVMIRGEATIINQDEIPGGIDNLRHRISTRYLGMVDARTSEFASDSSKWSAFRITPHQSIALQQKQSED